MTTTGHLTYWPESEDKHIELTDPELLPWNSQYDYDSADENSSDSLFCIDPFQEVFPDISDLLLDHYSLLASGISAENERVKSSDENCTSKNSDHDFESHDIYLGAASGRQNRLQSPSKEPRANFHRERHVSETFDPWLLKPLPAIRVHGNTLSTPPEQHSSKAVSEAESYSASERTRRKRAHCLVAKRYRESLNSKFLQLEKDVLNISRDQDRRISKNPCRTLNQSKRPRPDVLELAHRSILSLRKEVHSLKKKLQILREATIPFETCQYTLPDD